MLRRAIAAVAATGLVAAIASAGLGTAPAGAASHPRMTISRAAPVAEQEFPPIPLDFAIATAVTPLPAGCGYGPDEEPDPLDPPPFTAMCDRIPLRIVIPTDLAQTDDFIVTVSLAWEDPVGAAAGESGTGNDMDLWVYDNQQIAQRTDPESTTYTEQTHSASLANPETVKLGSPQLVDYTIIVVNATGQNVGYTIKAEMKIAKGDAIFELLEQPIARPKAVDPPPVDLSADPIFGPLLAQGLAAIAELPLDAELDVDFGPATLERQLQAPPAAVSRVGESKPKPVSGITLLFWLVIVPLGLLGGTIAFMLRRGVLGAGRSL